MQIYGLYLIVVVILCFYIKPSVAKILQESNSASRNEEDRDQAAESIDRGASEKRKMKAVPQFEDLNEDMETCGDKGRAKRSEEQPIIAPLEDTLHNHFNKRELGQLHRDALIEIDKHENDANLHGGKYADVLASFKIDNRLKTDFYKNDDAVSIEKRLEKSKLTKRYPLQHETHVKKSSNVVGTSAEKTKREVTNLEKVEQNIMKVFDDLGIAETKGNALSKGSREKRDYGEDEDLENGANKISMTKENIERSKKYFVSPNVEDVLSKGNVQNSAHLNKKKRSYTPKIFNYQYEGEEYIRHRRHNPDIGTIVKDLETSGELTVSGNKSPLISVYSSENNSDNKRGVDASSADNISDNMKKRNNDYGDDDDDEDEKMLEKNIQDKIFAIRADVKREIYNLKQRERKKKSIDVDGKVFKGKVIGEMRLNRQLGEHDSVEHYPDDVSDDNDQGSIEMSRKRKDKNNDDEMDFGSEDERTADVGVNSDLAKFPYHNGKKSQYIDGFKRQTKTSEDSKIAINSQSVSQESMPANVVGQVPAPSAAVMPSSLQPTNQLQQFVNQPQQQQPIVNNNVAAPSGNKEVLVQGQANPSPQVTQANPLAQVTQANPSAQVAQANPSAQVAQANPSAQVAQANPSAQVTQANPSAQVTQQLNTPQLSNAPNQLSITGTVDAPRQDVAELVQKQQHAPIQDTKTKSGRSNPFAIDTKKSMGRQNLINEYDDCYEDRVNAAPRSADVELEDAVRIGKDINDDKTLDNEGDSANDKKLVRPERFLQDITEEELLNLENENPSLEQRRRRQAGNYYQPEDFNTNHNNTVENALIVIHRGKRAYYDERIKGVRQNKLEHSNDESIDFLPEYKVHNRIRKRQASKSAAFSGHASSRMKHRKIQSNNRNDRKKRLGSKMNRKVATDTNMEALSNCELFGGLPQSFQGELSRFKRVKRC